MSLANNLAALNAEFLLTIADTALLTNVGSCQSVTVQVSGTYVGTLIVEGTVDGTNYVTVPVVQESALLGTATFPSAATGLFSGPCAGFRILKVRMSAYTSGTAVVSMIATAAPWKFTDWESIPSVLNVTATAAVNTGVTCTLPLVAGLCHYITGIHIERQYSVIGVAAAAPNIVTTTNIPGLPSWNFGQGVVAAGLTDQIDFSPAAPIRSTTAGVATTIVCPAQIQSIWRATAHYYLGP
jgi:hypothetical protein